MTSEVVVMNSLAVALAADSAATVSDGHNNKVYNSANKLFMLSKRHPVGAMVYNNSSLLGIPWETILKIFREKLGDKEFNTLEEYGNHLIDFLNNNDFLFPAPVQRKFYLDLVATLYSGIYEGVKGKILEHALNDAPGEPDAPSIAKEVVGNSLADWRSKADVDCFDLTIGKTLATSCSGEISELTAKTFDGLADANLVTQLQELATLVVTKDEILSESLSGLVIAGFGKEEYFPVLQMFEIGEVFQGKLKFRRAGVEKINHQNLSVVKPFAQSEMVDTFLDGINPAFELRMIEEVVALIVGLPDEVIDAISDLSADKKSEWKDKILPGSRVAIGQFVEKLKVHREKRHLGPIRQAIINLPIDELAHVASSLVNLNLFQKRMSLRPETVGGPIDVAVISKGDGFVWIERKHYFRPELNHQFFSNYTRHNEHSNHNKNDKQPGNAEMSNGQ